MRPWIRCSTKVVETTIKADGTAQVKRLVSDEETEFAETDASSPRRREDVGEDNRQESQGAGALSRSPLSS